ncbi:hypothetical protein EPO33_00870 [Patescibacteria group bacterium]|nr:MAG: hypothetical protein EPO33_00870 [Patescibacteria group bacterium]
MNTAPVTRTIYVLVGLPFSGKTTLAAQLVRENDAYLIERDRFLEDLRHDPQTRARVAEEAQSVGQPISRLASIREENARNDVLTRIYVERVRDMILATEKPVVIVDGTHLQALSRSFIRELPGWRTVAVVLPTDAEECIRRLTSSVPTGIRSAITPDLIRRMAAVYEPPGMAEGFDELHSA